MVFASLEHSPLQRVADVISFLHQRRQQIRRTGICLDIAGFRVTQNALRDGHVILFRQQQRVQQNLPRMRVRSRRVSRFNFQRSDAVGRAQRHVHPALHAVPRRPNPLLNVGHVDAGLSKLRPGPLFDVGNEGGGDVTDFFLGDAQGVHILAIARVAEETLENLLARLCGLG